MTTNGIVSQPSAFRGAQVVRRYLNQARLALIFATALWATGNAIAENEERAFTLSPFLGGQGFPVLFNGEEHFDADLYMGLRGGYNFTKHIRGEILFGYNDTKRDPGDIPINLFQYGADLNYHFRPDKALVPYVSAGFGALTADFREQESHPSNGTSSYFNAGGGVEYALARWVALRADFRYTITLDHGEQGFSGGLGFTFQFGRR